MSIIHIEHGNLIEAEVEALVNTVNCVGVMGKGIALQFRLAFPDNYKQYARACRNGQVIPGQMFIVETDVEQPKYIINFPTKRHWRGRSKLSDIKAGLSALIDEVQRLSIKSIAVPPLGCGNGGLDWAVVKPLIEEAFAKLPMVEVMLFAPSGAPDASHMPVATKKPSLTHARAILLNLLDRYSVPGYQLTLLEIQKLAYFLQASGESMKLTYEKNKYGPYAEALNHVLQRFEGHYLRGYGDRSSRALISVIPDAVSEAASLLEDSAESQLHLERVSRLIEGFETPYGLELLATIHWVVQDSAEHEMSREEVISAVHAWDQRKQRVFRADHIAVAWQKLWDQGWIRSTQNEALLEQVH